MVQRICRLVDSFALTEIQKFIFVERTLKETTLLFVRSESTLTSYEALKHALIYEFKHTSSPAQIHEMLAARSYKLTEKFSEYFLFMKEIAQKGNVDDASLMYYILNP